MCLEMDVMSNAQQPTAAAVSTSVGSVESTRYVIHGNIVVVNNDDILSPHFVSTTLDFGHECSFTSVTQFAMAVQAWQNGFVGLAKRVSEDPRFRDCPYELNPYFNNLNVQLHADVVQLFDKVLLVGLATRLVREPEFRAAMMLDDPEELKFVYLSGHGDPLLGYDLKRPSLPFVERYAELFSKLPPGVNLIGGILTDLRNQYRTVSRRSSAELEKWSKQQIDSASRYCSELLFHHYLDEPPRGPVIFTDSEGRHFDELHMGIVRAESGGTLEDVPSLLRRYNINVMEHSSFGFFFGHNCPNWTEDRVLKAIINIELILRPALLSQAKPMVYWFLPMPVAPLSPQFVQKYSDYLRNAIKQFPYLEEVSEFIDSDPLVNSTDGSLHEPFRDLNDPTGFHLSKLGNAALWALWAKGRPTLSNFKMTTTTKCYKNSIERPRYVNRTRPSFQREHPRYVNRTRQKIQHDRNRFDHQSRDRLRSRGWGGRANAPHITKLNFSSLGKDNSGRRSHGSTLIDRQRSSDTALTERSAEKTKSTQPVFEKGVEMAVADIPLPQGSPRDRGAHV